MEPQFSIDYSPLKQKPSKKDITRCKVAYPRKSERIQYIGAVILLLIVLTFILLPLLLAGQVVDRAMVFVYGIFFACFYCAIWLGLVLWFRQGLVMRTKLFLFAERNKIGYRSPLTDAERSAHTSMLFREQGRTVGEDVLNFEFGNRKVEIGNYTCNKGGLGGAHIIEKSYLKIVLPQQMLHITIVSEDNSVLADYPEGMANEVNRIFTLDFLNSLGDELPPIGIELFNNDAYVYYSNHLDFTQQKVYEILFRTASLLYARLTRQDARNLFKESPEAVAISQNSTVQSVPIIF